jgi:hypothetical protein
MLKAAFLLEILLKTGSFNNIKLDVQIFKTNLPSSLKKSIYQLIFGLGKALLILALLLITLINTINKRPLY